MPAWSQNPTKYLSILVDPGNLSVEDKHLLDSLIPLYHQAKHDTDRINILGRIVETCNDDKVWPIYNDLMEKAATTGLSKKAISQAEKIFFNSKLADVINNKGFIKINEGLVNEALIDFLKGYSIQKGINNKKGMAHCLANIGYVYKNKGDIFKAIDSYHQALMLSEEMNDEKTVAHLYNNIGLLYKNQGEGEKALSNYKKSYDLWKKFGNTSGMSAALNNIAFLYSGKGEYDKALENYRICLKYDAENQDDLGYANSLNNIGLIFERTGFKDSAYSYYLNSLEIYEKIKSRKGLSEVLNNLSKIKFDKGETDEAFNLCSRSLAIAQELGYPVLISDAAALMYDIYKRKKEWQKAAEMHELFSQMKDSILNNETQKAAMRQQLKYEFEKQEENAKMERQRQEIVNQEEKKRQRIISISAGSGLFLMVIFAGFIYSRYRISQRQKKIIQQQKTQVDLAYDQLSEKNREIIDSIHYAKRIQTALLKEEEHVSNHLPEHFIFFRPKDIVSGDFYWSYEREGFWYLAAADCTGHGVPGAFLTMLGTSFLNEIVNSKDLMSPAEILNELRKKIVKELSQSQTERDGYNLSLVKDGMDMSMLKLHLQTGKAEWAGANNGLLLFRKSEPGEEFRKYKYEPDDRGNHVIYVHPDKQPVGYSHQSTPFTNHQFTFIKGDTLYLYTDGYADQFGGPQGKKLKFRALQQLLAEHQQSALKDQKLMLSDKFSAWKGKLEQVDDVTMIGVRI